VNELRAEVATSPRSLEEIVQQLRDKVATQSAELAKNNEAISQLKIERDILKIEVDALPIQRVETDKNSDLVKRLETERDKLKNEVDTLQSQRLEWDKGSELIKRLEIERDKLKNEIDTLKSQIAAIQKAAPIEPAPTKPAPIRPAPITSAPTKPSTTIPGPVFLPLDATQRAQFLATDLNEKKSDQDENEHRVASWAKFQMSCFRGFSEPEPADRVRVHSSRVQVMQRDFGRTIESHRDFGGARADWCISKHAAVLPSTRAHVSW